MAGRDKNLGWEMGWGARRVAMGMDRGMGWVVVGDGYGEGDKFGREMGCWKGMGFGGDWLGMR